MGEQVGGVGSAECCHVIQLERVLLKRTTLSNPIISMSFPRVGAELEETKNVPTKEGLTVCPASSLISKL